MNDIELQGNPSIILNSAQKSHYLQHHSSTSTPLPIASILPTFNLERQPGVKEATSPGFFGKDVPHILTYNPAEVRSVLVPFLDRHLTVCGSLWAWMYHLGYLIYAILLMVILGYSAFPDGAMGQGGACDDDNTSQNVDMCQLLVVLTDAKSDFRFLIAFILSGYVGISVGRWFLRRQNYASLCGNARNLNLLLSSLIPLATEDNELMRTRRTLARWVILAGELAVLKARGHMDSDEGKAFLEDQKLIDYGEWDAMVNGDRHTTVFWWINLKSVQLQRDNVISSEHVLLIAKAVSSMRAQANDLMSSLDRDKPFPYSAICGMLVFFNLLIMSSWKGVEWATWFFTFGDQLFRQSRFWVDILVLFVWNLSYAALYDLGYMLHNPFGNRRVDVAHEAIFSGIRTLAEELAEGEPHLPPAMRDPKMK